MIGPDLTEFDLYDEATTRKEDDVLDEVIEKEYKERREERYIDLMRNFFIATDDDRSSEHVLQPELERNRNRGDGSSSESEYGEREMKARLVFKGKQREKWIKRIYNEKHNIKEIKSSSDSNSNINSTDQESSDDEFDLRLRRRIYAFLGPFNNYKNINEIHDSRHEPLIEHRVWPQIAAPNDNGWKYLCLSLRMLYHGVTTPVRRKTPFPQLYNYYNSPYYENCFSKYKEFDEHMHYSNKKTKTFRIHFENMKSPLIIIIKRKAKVFELIGLACYIYTLEDLKPKLKYDHVNYYCLKIMDDNKIEHDLPPLDHYKSLKSFDFSDLALVETNDPNCMAPVKVFIMVRSGDHLTFSYKDKDILLLEIFQSALKIIEPTYSPKNPAGIITYDFEHVVAKKDLDLETKLYSYDPLEFYLYPRNHSRPIRCLEEYLKAQLNLNSNYLYKGDLIRNESTKLSFKIDLSRWKLKLENELPTRSLAAASNYDDTKPLVYEFQFNRVVDCSFINNDDSPKDTKQVRLLIADYERSNYSYEDPYVSLDFEMKKEDSKDFMKIVHALIPDVLSIYYVRYANGNRTLIREWNPDEHKRYDD